MTHASRPHTAIVEQKGSYRPNPIIQARVNHCRVWSIPHKHLRSAKRLDKTHLPTLSKLKQAAPTATPWHGNCYLAMVGFGRCGDRLDTSILLEDLKYSLRIISGIALRHSMYILFQRALVFSDEEPKMCPPIVHLNSGSPQAQHIQRSTKAKAACDCCRAHVSLLTVAYLCGRQLESEPLVGLGDHPVGSHVVVRDL